MKKSYKFISVMFSCFLVVSISTTIYAHSGKTDANGGHRDNNNVSGLGYYHYHHGYSAHLHTGGVCPFDPTTVPKPPVTPPSNSSGYSAALSNSPYLQDDGMLSASELRPYLEEEYGLNIPPVPDDILQITYSISTEIFGSLDVQIGSSTARDFADTVNLGIEKGYIWGYVAGACDKEKEYAASSNAMTIQISDLETTNSDLYAKVSQKDLEIEHQNDRYDQVEAIFNYNLQLLYVYQALSAVAITAFIIAYIKYRKVKKAKSN